MTKHLIISLLLLAVATPLLHGQDDSLRMDAVLNRSAEAYALTFRDMEGGMEAWLTIGPDLNNDQRVLARSVCSNDGFGSTIELSDPALNAPSTRAPFTVL